MTPPGSVAPVSRTLPVRVLREIRRRWRRFRRSLSSRSVRLVYHSSYAKSLSAVPLDRRRAERILGFLADEGLVEPGDIAAPRPPALRTLLRVHDAAYLEALQRPETAQRIFGVSVADEDLEAVVEMQRLMVGGTMYATVLALRSRGVACNLGGGLHHARRDSGLAFCLFNDVAIAIARQRSRGYRGRILVVDLDLHDGNGTRQIFAHDPTVHTYSIHNEHWSDTTAVASTAIALGSEVTDEVYLGTLLKTLPDVIREHEPELVYFLAGTDPAADDSLGNWQITPAGMLRRDQLVFDLLRRPQRSVPVVMLLGGGYGGRSWTYTGRTLTWLLTGRPVEPPLNEELTLRTLRRLTASLDPASLTSDPDSFSLKLTEEDLAGILPGVARSTRFLGYFSAHGIELLLERCGILDQLRVRGFAHPTVALDLGNGIGHTLRIFAEPDRAELLVELRVSRSSRLIPQMTVLVVEWLLLQNPRADFGPYRRPLPGQKHPGLRMLKDVFGWLVMVAEILAVDGIYFAPSSYHVAAQSRHVVRFLQPEHEAAFRALERLFEGRPLAEASRSVAEGRVLDEVAGEPYRWPACPMVLPVSDRLAEQVSCDDYEARVEQEMQGLRFGTAPTAVG